MTSKYCTCNGITLTKKQLSILNMLYEKKGEVQIDLGRVHSRLFCEGWVVSPRYHVYVITPAGESICEMFANRERCRKEKLCAACGTQPRAYAKWSYCKSCAATIDKRNKLNRVLRTKR